MIWMHRGGGVGLVRRMGKGVIGWRESVNRD